MKKHTLRPSSFTLVELLVVISIIGLLAGLAFPAIQGAMNSAKKGKAKAEMQSIITALKAYQAEYGRFPSPNSPEGDGDTWYGTGDGSSESPAIFRILSGSNVTANGLQQNPREIAFLELPAGSTNGFFRDPWGKKNYALKLDTSGDGKVNYWVDIRAPVLLISFGKDGNQQEPGSKGCDDLYSWR